MTISTRVQEQLFEMKAAAAAQAAQTAGTTPSGEAADALTLIRLAPTSSKEGGVIVATSSTSKVVRTWTRAEHERFLAGLELYPHGPWKQIADHVGTKTTRQTMAHAQKYRQKIARRRQQIALQQQQQQQVQQLQQLHQLHQQQQQLQPTVQQPTLGTANVEIKAEPIVTPPADVGEDGDDDDDDDDQSTTSEESAAALVEARMAETLCDGGGDEFFMTEILPLLQQLDPSPVTGFGVSFLSGDSDHDIVMSDAFDMDMPSPVPHFPPTSTFF
jgi:SHAQKYF class myb-like DNA-binding protein